MRCPNCGNSRIEVMDIGIVRWKQCSACLFEFDFDGVDSPEIDTEELPGGDGCEEDDPCRLEGRGAPDPYYTEDPRR